MAAKAPSPEVLAAVKKGAVADLVLLGVGGAVAYATGQMVWVLVGAVAGSAIMLLLMAQAGAFGGRDDRR